jgi:hypothetical protein
MCINLFGASDRIGGNIIDIVSQISYAFNNNICINYNRQNLRIYSSYNQNYNNTIFMQTLFDIIDKHNTNPLNQNINIDLAAPSHFEVLSKTLLNLEIDLFTFFKEKIYKNEFRKEFLNKAKLKNYQIPFDPKNTILVHLRLEDVRNRVDYDGSICANYFKSHIENGLIADGYLFENMKNQYPNNNAQAPLSFNKVQKIIDKILLDKPNHEVIIITNPNENISQLPYRYISNNDECYDLFLLCNCENLILSRSNFALSSLFFGMAKNIHLPLWSLIPCFGLYTKYDQTNFNYFI